ncbi:MAG: NADH:ubiquinone reductase (Na(+)-transporting) subunit C [Flavobacteriales bacterium]|nr:NADH:ubiquinone reductase (Na(+)-transporting) subunit C [Flavobacteriales bacterium]
MDRNSNAYTFIFAAVLIIVVGTLLAVAAEGLKPFQKANIRKEKMQNILASVGMEVTPEEAQSKFDKYITKQVVIDAYGKEVSSPATEAFEIDVLKDYKAGLSVTYKQNKGDMDNMRQELSKFKGSGVNYPLFVCTLDDNSTNYIVPLVGTGLWGPIWGYIAIGPDKNTVVGTTFDHKTETPGLGAEIKEGWFEKPWEGKKIFDESGAFKSVKVIKGGAGDSNPHGVDAISGGTITSNGVSEMVERTLKIYEPFLKNM